MMKKWIYKHYKWNLYEVLWIAIHTESDEKLVLYKALYDNLELKKEYWEIPFFVRPYKMFDEFIFINWEKLKRFDYIWDKKYENI